MHFYFISVFWILLATSVLSLSTALIAWPKRHLPGGFYFFLMMLAVTEYALVAALESAAIEQWAKIFWSKWEYLGSNMTVVLFLFFVVDYTGKRTWLSKQNRFFIFSLVVVNLLLVATNDWHGWVWDGYTPSMSVPNAIIYHHGPVFYYIIAFFYVIITAATLILFFSSVHASILQKRQTRLILLATLCPWFGSFIYILNLSPMPGLDLTPISFLGTGVILLISINTNHFLHLVPIARDCLIEIMLDGMMVTDAQFRIVDMNNRASELLNLKMNDVLGKEIIHVLEVQSAIESIKRDYKPVIFDHHFETCNNHLCLEIHLSSILNHNRQPVGFLFVLHDMTQQKQAEREREALIQELHEANDTKNRFFSIVSHDLKGPFLTINSYLQLIQNNWGDLTQEKFLKLTDELNSSVKNTYSFLENLLSWARSQTGALQYNLKEISVVAVVDNVMEIVLAQANQKEIKIVNHIVDDCLICADANITGTILRNLISNAIKFTPREGKIELKCQKLKELVQIDVVDSGVGMEPALVNDLFKLDKTVTLPGTDNERGSGLGLILCREFAEKQGGTIQVQSEEGKGSTFSITLPSSCSGD